MSVLHFFLFSSSFHFFSLNFVMIWIYFWIIRFTYFHSSSLLPLYSLFSVFLFFLCPLFDDEKICAIKEKFSNDDSQDDNQCEHQSTTKISRKSLWRLNTNLAANFVSSLLGIAELLSSSTSDVRTFESKIDTTFYLFNFICLIIFYNHFSYFIIQFYYAFQYSIIYHILSQFLFSFLFFLLNECLPYFIYFLFLRHNIAFF